MSSSAASGPPLHELFCALLRIKVGATQVQPQVQP